MAITKRQIFQGFQWLFFTVLLVLSVVFYREKLLADSGYYLARVINSGQLWPEHGRYILILSQLLAWIGVVLHLPLKAVLILYSVNHLLFPVIVFYISVYRLQQPMAGIVLLLLQVAGITTGFLVPMFELYYAAVLLVLLASILYSGKTGFWPAFFMLVSGFFIMSSHPVGIAMIAMVLGFYTFSDCRRRLKLYLGFLAILALLVAIKIFSVSDYESGKTAVILNEIAGGKYNLAFFRQLLAFLATHYAFIGLLAVLIAVLMLLNQRYKMLIAYFVSLMIFIALSALNTGIFELSRYNEQVWFPIIFAVVFPLLTGLEKTVKGMGSVLLVGLLLLFGSWRLFVITENALQYSERTKVMMRLINHARTMDGHRFIVDEFNITNPLSIGANWSYPIETMLLSSEGGPSESVSICTLEDYTFEDNFKKLTASDYLFRRFEIEPLSTVNRRYFNPGTGRYIPLNDTNLQRTDTGNYINGLSIKILGVSNSYASGEFIRIPVEISTASALPSARKYNICLVSSWESDDNWISKEVVTPLEVDVAAGYLQDIVAETPSLPGKYTLIISIKDIGHNKLLATAKKSVQIKK